MNCEKLKALYARARVVRSSNSYILSFSRMSCVPSVFSSSSSYSNSSKCAFASDRLAILERSVANYSRMRAAALDAGRSGAIESRFIAEDVATLDRKMEKALVKMVMLKPCVRS